MTAWEQLTANSTLPSGTAWQHLMNQQGGGGATYLVVADGISVEMAEMEFQVELDDAQVAAAVDDSAIEAVLDDEAIVVEEA